MAEHHDPVAHHAAHAVNETGMKKKLGPLPVWAWAAIIGGAVIIYIFMHRSSSSSTSSTAANSANSVDPNNPLGLTYAQEQQDIQEGIDPNTGVSYASENAAGSSSMGSGGGGGGDTTTGGGSGSGGTTPIVVDIQAPEAPPALPAPAGAPSQASTPANAPTAGAYHGSRVPAEVHKILAQQPKIHYGSLPKIGAHPKEAISVNVGRAGHITPVHHRTVRGKKR